VSLPGTAYSAALDALGDRFEAAVLGTPTAAPAVREVFRTSAKAVTSLPAVILEPQPSEFVPDSGVWRHTWNVDVILLLAKRPADPVRVEVQRQAYVPYLLGATEAALKLGLGAQAGWELKSAMPSGWEYVEYDVADVTYDGVRVGYQIIVNETVSLVP
jgi:hypothetical protein